MGSQGFMGFSKKLPVAVITAVIVGAAIFLVYVGGGVSVAPRQVTQTVSVTVTQREVVAYTATQIVAVTQVEQVTTVKTIAITTTALATAVLPVTTVRTVTEVITATEAITVTPLDSDGDGIFDEKELEYGTDPYKPNHLFFYALKKLSKEEALKFKNVENFNASSITLVDLYADIPPYKRNFKEINDLLNKILLDNIVNEHEKNLLDDNKFINPTQPTITNLKWIPTRENLDKIYDIDVTFVAKDDKTPIVYAELRFIPVEYYYMVERYGMRPEDYPKVFPPDKERVFVLTPIDGKFDSLEESFIVSIKDIVGGREYRIVALVRDLAGNERIIEIKTPYIRQFENLGKLAYEKGIIVGVSYLGWYKIDRDSWDSYKYRGEPLLGEYSSLDRIVLTKHIDWMTGHGINTIFINWPPAWGMGRTDKVIENLINSDLGGHIRYSILYLHGENSNLDDDKVIDEITTHLSYLLNLIPNELLLKLDNRPLIYFYDLPAYKGDISSGIDKIRSNVEKLSGEKIFIMGDYAKFRPSEVQEIIRKLDGVTVWAAHYDITGSYEGLYDYEAFYNKKVLEWNSWLKEKIAQGMFPYFYVYLPSVIPEFDSRYAHFGGPQVILPRDAERFARQLALALSHSIPKGMVRIDTWDDWYESTIIEPSVRWEFKYLQIIKEVVSKILGNP